MRIDRVEDWLGRPITGSDGERIGKLEDIIFVDGDQPLLGAVSTGLFGRRTSLVPLAEASLSPDRIAVPYTKAQVKDAPQLDDTGAMSAVVEDQTEAHYGLAARDRSTDEEYLSAGERIRRLEEAAAADQRATALEQQAEDLTAQARQADDDARAAQDRADALAHERDSALADARRARTEHERLVQ